MARGLLVIVLLMACKADVNYDGTAFQCEVTSDCPPGHTCREGRCSEPCGDWFDCNFERRLKVTLDHTGEDLVNFPLPVFLDATRIDYGATQERGQDVRFVDADGAVLAHEIETWNELATSLVWVRVPVIDASKVDHVWLYYGNENAPDGQAATTVWSEDYRGVWHLDRDPGGASPQAFDSTQHMNHGIASAMMADDLVPAPLGNGFDFDGVDDAVRVPFAPSLDLTATVTLSAWVKMTAVQTVDAGIIVRSDQTGASIFNMQLSINSPDSAHMRIRTPTELLYPTAVTVLLPDRWYYLAGVYDGTDARFFVDGIEEASEPGGGPIVSTVEPLLIGRRAIGDERFLLGAIDEARIEVTARTGTWIRATYRAMTDALQTYGAEEMRPRSER